MTRGSWGLPAAILLGVIVRVPFWIEVPADADRRRHRDRGSHGASPGARDDALGTALRLAARRLGGRAFRGRDGPDHRGPASPRLPPRSRSHSRRLRRGQALHPDAALPAAVLMACPPPYFLLMAVLPPPFYATTLVLCGLILLLGLRLGACARFPGRAAPGPGPARLAGRLALWTHLMSASVVAAVGLHLVGRSAGRRRVLLVRPRPVARGQQPVVDSPPRRAGRRASCGSRDGNKRWASTSPRWFRGCPRRSAEFSDSRPPGGRLGGLHRGGSGLGGDGLVLIYGGLLWLAVRLRERTAAPGCCWRPRAWPSSPFLFPCVPHPTTCVS